ncbi:MAG: hypothetical protein WCT52_04075 [Candidatus Micrarchaeia archaeon]|jgi:hypothetical protein
MAARKKNDAKGTTGMKQNVKNGAAKAAVFTLALIAAAIGIIAISSLLLPDIGRAFRGGPGHFPPENEIAFLEDNMALRSGLSALNVAIVVYLLYVYVKDYVVLRTNFTLGIIAVLFSFLLYAFTSSPLMRLVLGQYGIASGISFVPMFFSAIGLLIFAKVGNE